MLVLAPEVRSLPRLQVRRPRLREGQVFVAQLTPNLPPWARLVSRSLPACSYAAEFRDWDPGLSTSSPRLPVLAEGLMLRWLGCEVPPQIRIRGAGVQPGLRNLFWRFLGSDHSQV